MIAESATNRVDWTEWSRRWDAQQSFLVVRREERFQVMFDVAEQILGRRALTILDLACGTGDIARRAMRRFPEARVVGVDADPLLLAIAGGAIGDAGGRARWVKADLRDPAWPTALDEPNGFDLVMSSTALHWLPTATLGSVYHALHGLVTPGGLVLNADVIPPLSSGALAAAADALRSRAAREAQEQRHGERYAEWWEAAAREPGVAHLMEERARLFVDHPDDVELPSADFHVQTLLDAGFAEATVLWRFFDYAVVAGIKAGTA